MKHKENGIVYVFDVTQCMFSSGNGTERRRIPSAIRASKLRPPTRTPALRCEDDVFVDMYCGIGYFTLGVILQCPSVEEIWACDWNPTALRFLETSVAINERDRGSRDRVHVMCGDSRALGEPNGPDRGRLRGRAHRICLGLLPTSEEGWSAAARLASNTGAFLHVHGLAAKHAIEEYGQQVQQAFTGILQRERGNYAWSVTVEHTERVKSYAPNQYHVVIDLYCVSVPQSTNCSSREPTIHKNVTDQTMARV